MTPDGHVPLDRFDSEGLEDTWASMTMVSHADSLENLQGAIDRQF